jgi:aminoglycoside phosphotransferase (APT) family kinase protein
VLHFEEEAGTLFETVVVGQPLLQRLTRESFPTLADVGTDWLIDLAGPCLSSPTDASAWNLFLRPLIAEFDQAWSPVLDTTLWSRTRAALKGLRPLPLVPEHRDFAPWNVRIDPTGGLGVLDWESATLSGLPGGDLIYFLAHLTFFVDGTLGSGHERESYRASLDAGTYSGRVRAACLARYAREVGLSDAETRLVSLLTWMVHARSEHARLTEDTALPPRREHLARGVFHQLWEEDARRVQVAR